MVQKDSMENRMCHSESELRHCDCQGDAGYPGETGSKGQKGEAGTPGAPGLQVSFPPLCHLEMLLWAQEKACVCMDLYVHWPVSLLIQYASLVILPDFSFLFCGPWRVLRDSGGLEASGWVCFPSLSQLDLAKYEVCYIDIELMGYHFTPSCFPGWERRQRSSRRQGLKLIKDLPAQYTYEMIICFLLDG